MLLDFIDTPAPGITGRENRDEVSTLDWETLLWDCFPGDVVIATPLASIQTTLGWVPGLHFALSLFRVSQSLLESRDGETFEYQFTESADKISFVRTGVNVVISATMSESELKVPVLEFRFDCADFLVRTVSALSTRAPGLLRHERMVARVEEARDIVNHLSKVDPEQR